MDLLPIFSDNIPILQDKVFDQHHDITEMTIIVLNSRYPTLSETFINSDFVEVLALQYAS